MTVPVATVAPFLDANHYLGAAKRGVARSDEFGVLVLASPTSRHLPTDWLELSRWCLLGERNAGSRQWARVVRWLRENHPTTTVISYSDPSVGHTGALYRATGSGHRRGNGSGRRLRVAAPGTARPSRPRRIDGSTRCAPTHGGSACCASTTSRFSVAGAPATSNRSASKGPHDQYN